MMHTSDLNMSTISIDTHWKLVHNFINHLNCINPIMYLIVVFVLLFKQHIKGVQLCMQMTLMYRHYLSEHLDMSFPFFWAIVIFLEFSKVHIIFCLLFFWKFSLGWLVRNRTSARTHTRPRYAGKNGTAPAIQGMIERGERTKKMRLLTLVAYVCSATAGMAGDGGNRRRSPANVHAVFELIGALRCTPGRETRWGRRGQRGAPFPRGDLSGVV